jgi:hypothetical protein
MSEHSGKKPLGLILQEAGLVSPSQVEIALRDQGQYENLRLGEILALRGWLKQETADFFAEHWIDQLTNQQKKPLGYYLKSAALLNEEQISLILNEQEKLDLRFGALTVLKGWLKQETIDFFLEHLTTQEKNSSPLIQEFLDSGMADKQILFMSEPQIIIPKKHDRNLKKPNLELGNSVIFSIR